ncbi:MAG: Cobyrinic acid ac-diamide synthase, partial [Verrucomicrobiales bacterium]|nr:Cobyrinic acid ac-diamide synthase [Verrucomicrobiales bacterium]
QYLRNHGSKLEVAGILMTMVQADQKESTEVVRELRALVPSQLLCQTTIPRDTVFLKASAAGVPLGLLHRQPPAAAHVFDQLAAELEPRLHLNPPDSANEYTRLMD